MTDNHPLSHNLTFMGQNVTAVLDLTQSPQIEFTSRAAPNNSLVVFRGNVSLYLEGNDILDVDFTLTMDTNITVRADSTLLLQVGLSDLNVTVLAGMPVDPVWLQQQVISALDVRAAVCVRVLLFVLGLVLVLM